MILHPNSIQSRKYTREGVFCKRARQVTHLNLVVSNWVINSRGMEVLDVEDGRWERKENHISWICKQSLL